MTLLEAMKKLRDDACTVPSEFVFLYRHRNCDIREKCNGCRGKYWFHRMNRFSYEHPLATRFLSFLW